MTALRLLRPDGLTFPPVIDSSMRAQFVSCPRSFFHRYMQHLSSAGSSVHLHFGAVFAHGLSVVREQVYLHDAPLDRALATATAQMALMWGDAEFTHEAKTFPRCVGALEAYFAHYPPATDHVRPKHLTDVGGTPILGTEFSAAVPLPILHPESGEPLIYSGRFDMLAEMHGLTVIEDDKTTSQLGPTWGRQWRLRAQFTGYAWLCSEFGYPAEGVVIRGISILKAAYGHAEVIESRPRWAIAAWHAQLLRDVRRMLAAWEEGFWDQSLDDACGSYGGCQFMDLCGSPEPEKWMSSFEPRIYDPLGVAE